LLLIYMAVGLLVLFSLPTRAATSSEPRHLVSDPDTLRQGKDLGEVVVVARRKLIQMRNDTTLINVGGLHTKRGGSLEYLLRKVPGMRYDRVTGRLTYNGKPLVKINLNGSTFMGNNIARALAALPAEAVSQLKIYDLLSTLEKATGITDGLQELTLDIQTKDEFNGALTTNVKAEHGTQGRRNDSALLNWLRSNGESLSFGVASSNLENTTAGNGNYTNSVSIDGNKHFGKQLKLNASASLYDFHHEMLGSSYSEEYLTTGTRADASTSSTNGRNTNGSLWFFSTYEMSKRSQLNVNFSASLYGNKSQSTQETQLFDKRARIDTITLGNEESISRGHSNSFSASADFTHAFAEGGTALSIVGRMDANSAQSTSNSHSRTHYRQLKNKLGADSLQLRELQQLSPTQSRQTSFTALLTQPLGKMVRLQAGWGIVAAKNYRKQDTYDKARNSGQWVDSLSNESRLTSLGQEFRLTFNYDSEHLSANGGLTLLPQRKRFHQRYHGEERDTTLRHADFKPMAHVRWRGKGMSVRLEYSGYTSQPSAEMLLAFRNTTDPLAIREGNPNLKPAFNSMFDLEWEHERWGLSLSASFQNTLNDFTEEMRLDRQSGARHYRQVNINGNNSFNANLGWNKQLGLWNLGLSMALGLRREVSLNGDETEADVTRSITKMREGEVLLLCGFVPKWGDITFSAHWQPRFSHNIQTQTRTKNHDFSLSVNAMADLPFDLELSTDASCYLHRGTMTSSDADQWLWNMSLAWSFLRSKQATLTLSWNDILNRRQSLERTASATGFNESYRPVIKSYVLLSFSYQLNFKKKEGTLSSTNQESANP
ncbi:MAG: outer membrane beta-barrel protein, partial [Prevotella sp.]